jgi:hypothetical protein
MSGGEDTLKAWHERRSEPREPAHDPARLLRDGDVMDALIVDRSLKGLRLRLPQGAAVGANMTMTALDLNRLMIHSVNVRTGEGPEAAAMRRLWSRASSPVG